VSQNPFAETSEGLIKATTALTHREWWDAWILSLSVAIGIHYLAAWAALAVGMIVDPARVHWGCLKFGDSQWLFFMVWVAICDPMLLLDWFIPDLSVPGHFPELRILRSALHLSALVATIAYSFLPKRRLLAYVGVVSFVVYLSVMVSVIRFR
jgi:hypothetical protein